MTRVTLNVKLLFAMIRQSYLFLFLLLAAALPTAQAAGQTADAPDSDVRILSPVEGQVLQGTVIITGGTGTDPFKSAELSFAYQGDPTGSWFWIDELTSPVAEGALTQWDTSTITDGNYTLRLLVTYEDGRQVEAKTGGLRVRNYSAIETSTPAAPSQDQTPVAGATPGSPGADVAVDLQALSTPSETGSPSPGESSSLPPNPAEVTDRELADSLGRGALVGAGAVALAGIYQFMKGGRGRGDRR